MMSDDHRHQQQQRTNLQSSTQLPAELVCFDRPEDHEPPLAITSWFARIPHAGKRKALVVIARSGNVSAAMRAAGMDRSSHQHWMETDPAYREAVADARAEYLDRIEAEIDRRAIQGVVKPLTYAGKVFGTIREYSDILLIFRAKRLDPAYRDNVHLSSDGSLADAGRQVIVLRPWSARELPQDGSQTHQDALDVPPPALDGSQAHQAHQAHQDAPDALDALDALDNALPERGTSP